MTNLDGPIVVLGVGGSGTRAVVRVLTALGVYMGFGIGTNGPAETPFAKVVCNLARGRMDDEDFQRLVAEALERLRRDMVANAPKQFRAWGWKYPRTHFIVPQIEAAFPGKVRVVHVWRHPGDMAFSNNVIRADFKRILPNQKNDGPSSRVDFWIAFNEFIRRQTKGLVGRVHDLIFDDMVGPAKVRVIGNMAASVGVNDDSEAVARAAKLVVKPRSVGRYKDDQSFSFTTRQRSDIASLTPMGVEWEGL